MITIVGFGDSITQAVTGMPNEGKRWLKVLDRRLAAAYPGKEFNVVNCGHGGYSDREKMGCFEPEVLPCEADFLLLQFGGNNSGFRNPARYVSPEESLAFLEQVRVAVPAKTRLVVITFPKLDEEWHAPYCSPGAVEVYQEFFRKHGGSEASLERYREKTREFARAHSLPLVDFHRAMCADPDPRRLQCSDGVHLNEMGNDLLAEMVFQTLQDEMDV